MNVLVGHVITDLLEPVAVLAGLVVRLIDPAAPLAHEQRIAVLLDQIGPGIVPVIIQKRLPVKGLGVILQIEPALLVDLGAVVVRGIHDLLGVLADIDRVILHAAQIAAPPCAEDLGRFTVMRIIDRRRCPVRTAGEVRIALRTLDHDKQIRILLKAGHGTALGGMLPVVLIGGIVPLGKLALLGLAVGLILQVNGNDGVVILVILREPRERFEPVVRGEIVIVPQRILVSGCIGGRAVDIHHDLDALLTAPGHDLIPDVEAVLCLAADDAFDRQLGVLVFVELDHGIRLTVLPLENDLGGHGHAQQIEAVVGNELEAIVDVGRPRAVKDLGSDIVAEPVDTGHPDLIAVHIHDLAVFDMQPVVVIGVRRIRGMGRNDPRSGQHHARENPRSQAAEKSFLHWTSLLLIIEYL